MPPHKTRAARKPKGAQPGNANARRHGVYAAPPHPLLTIADILADAQARQAQLSAYIDATLTDPEGADTETVVKLLGLHGQNASRLGRLLRDQRALTGAAADGMAAAIGQALDELSTEWGVEL